jgi:hypothetical protein
MAIRRDDNKYTRLSLQQYDGQARNGEIVIDLDTYTVWVGDASGALLPVGGGNTANATIGNLIVTGTSNLGDIANITILGGTPGSVLSTDGAGNLVWSPAIPTTYNDSNVEALLASGNITSNIITTGNVSGGFILGDGGLLSNIAVAYGNANVEVLLASGNIATDIITTANANVGNFNLAGIANLGSNLNVRITGGNSGEVLTTDGTGNLSWSVGGSTTAVVPAIYFTATSTGNNQTFSNIYIAAYTSNTDITLFYNGALLDSDFYTLSGDTITVTTPVNAGDSIDIIRTAIANANVISGYGNTEANAFLAAGLVGNILPDGDAVYSLGNSTNQWKDLWVSNSTIYFNTVPLTSNSTTLTFAGEPLLVNNGSSNITTTGVIETGGLVSNGNVVAETGYFFLGDGGLLSNISGGGSYGNAEVANYLPTYTGNLGNVDSITTANLEVTGSANLGSNSTVTLTGGTNGQYLQTDGSGGLSWADAVSSFIPAIYFPVVSAGNNQTFSNSFLASYTSNTDITLFYNGVLLENIYYTLAGDTITINTTLAIGDSIDLIQTAAGNVNVITGTYANSNVEAYLNSGQISDIIPSGNAVYSLGNLTNQWKDLWVSNATIYFNTVPLSANNNTLTFAGEPILVSGGNTNITTTGVVETGGLVSDGNIIANTGYFFVGDGGFLSNVGGTGNAAGANTQIQFNDSNAFSGSANFTFTNTGSGLVTIGGELTLLGNGTIGTAGSNLLLQPAGNAIVEVAGRQWVYDLTGNLTVPGNIQSIATGGFTSNIIGIDTGQPTVLVILASEIFGPGDAGQVTISGVVGTTEANGTWYFQAYDTDRFELYTDGTFTTPVNGSTWTAYVSGGAAVSAGNYTNLTITGGNVIIGANTLVANGNVTAVGNITAQAGSFFVGDGGLLSNISTGTVYSNANVAAYMPTYTGNLGNVNNITLSGTITGNGVGLSDIAGANVTGQVANALVAGTVYTNAQPNITSVGSLTSLDVVGNITLGAGGFFIGDGGLLSNISGGGGTYGNGDVAVYLPTYTGNLGNVDSITTTGNITVGTGSFIIADGTYLTNVPGAVAESPFSIETASFSAVAGARYGVDTTGGAVTATLPATPATGQAIFFADAGGAYATNNLTVSPNGLTIMGDSGDMIVNTPNQNFGLFWNGTTWRTY